MPATYCLDGLDEKSYLANELLSLGVTAGKVSEIDTTDELDNLVDMIKQNYIKEYRMAYPQSKDESEVIVI